MGGKGRARAARCVQRPLEGEWRIAVPPPLKPPAKPNWFDRNSKQSLRPRLERPGGGPGARGASGWGGGGRWWYHQTPRHPPRAARGPRKPPPGPARVPGGKAAAGARRPGGPPGHLGPGCTRRWPPGVPREGEDPVGRPPQPYRRGPAPTDATPWCPRGTNRSFCSRRFLLAGDTVVWEGVAACHKRNHDDDFSWDKQSCHESLGTGFSNLKPWAWR